MRRVRNNDADVGGRFVDDVEELEVGAEHRIHEGTGVCVGETMTQCIRMPSRNSSGKLESSHPNVVESRCPS